MKLKYDTLKLLRLISLEINILSLIFKYFINSFFFVKKRKSIFEKVFYYILFSCNQLFKRLCEVINFFYIKPSVFL